MMGALCVDDTIDASEVTLGLVIVNPLEKRCCAEFIRCRIPGQGTPRSFIARSAVMNRLALVARASSHALSIFSGMGH